MVTGSPRLAVISARFFPASEASKRQLDATTFFGSPPPRSSRMMVALSALIFSRVAGIVEALHQRRPSAFLRPRRQQRRLDAGGRGGVGIHVDGRVHASRARLVDQLQRVDRSTPVLLADHLVVRHLGRQAAAFADRDGLANAVHDAAGLVAHVRDVDAAHAAGDLGQLDDLVGRRERARHVEQARAQAERALFHALPHQPAHPLELLGGRGAIGTAHHLAADGTLADESGKIRRDARGGDSLEERLQRHVRTAVRPLDQRRHALPHVVVGGRDLEDPAPRVRVNVDEAGRHDQAAHVDHARRGLGDERGDAGDGVALDGDVGSIPWAAGAVDDPAVSEHQIVGGRLGAHCAREQQGHEHDTTHPRDYNP